MAVLRRFESFRRLCVAITANPLQLHASSLAHSGS
jgi:hypothetical protein